MASSTATTCTPVIRVSASHKAAWLPMVPAYSALLPQSQRHGGAMGTGVVGGATGALDAIPAFDAERSEVIADAKPNFATGRLPRDRQPV